MSNNQIIGTSALNPQREIFRIKSTTPQESVKLRVAGYARVSSDSYDQLNSFSAQVRYYTKLIEQNESWELAEIFADEGISGVSTEKRDDFNRMLRNCREGKIDRIITKSTSRFARNTLDTIRTIRELKDIGVTVLFEKENIDTANITSENLLTLYAMFAQQESVSISQNAKKANRMRMQSGTYVSSNVPYGYRLIDNQPRIHEPEAEIVQRIFSEYLAGWGVSLIARRLTEDQILRKSGGSKWWPQVVLKILKNERYAGDMLLQKSYNDDTLPYRKCINRGELPQYYIKNTHEPIISRIEFELANILLKERGDPNRNVVYGDYPLSRKIRCVECGIAYRRKVTNGKVYWVCRTHDQDKDLCGSQRITEDAIYGAFVRLYNKLRKNYVVILLPMLNRLEKLQELRTRGNAEISAINKHIAELSERNHVMNGLLSKGILDSALFIAQTDELNRKIRMLKHAKANLMEKEAAVSLTDRTEDLIEVIENGPDSISSMDERLFSELVEHINAQDNETVDFVLVGGLTLTERLCE
jgi:DNA invertase Pin-like site-specific DNA recombinase